MSEQSPEEQSFGASTRLFQINEDDLAELERLLPVFCDRLYPMLGKSEGGANKLRIQLGKAKDIISNVRWNYGPPLDVVVIPAGDPK